MPLWQHLDELRTVLIRCLAAILIGIAITYNFSDRIILFLEKPLLDVLPEGARFLYFTGIADKFIVYIKISVLASCAGTAPYLLYQFWVFVSPALYRHEKRFVIPFVFLGSLFFLLGLAFAYWIVVPFGYKFLIHFGSPTDKPIITLTEYFSLTIKLMLAMGLMFELPVVLVLLSKFGIVSADFLVRHRKQAVIIIATVSAIATPSPDAFTMVIVMVPLWLLYEFSIVAVRWAKR